MPDSRVRTVTLLFTDLERSTEVLQALGDDEAQALWRTHFRLLRDAVAARGGQEVKSLGDGVMVVFTSALEALACAVAMQQAVHRQNRQQKVGHRLQVRVGLHVGEPIPDAQDYFGMPVVVAQRLCSTASGGQILVSDLVRRLIGSHGPYTFRDQGSLTLKGLAEPLRAYEVVWEPESKGPAAPVPAHGVVPAPAAEEPTPSLPLPPLLAGTERTTFVGRRREMEQLWHCWERVRKGQPRLALVTGEAGVGKTRLAAEFTLAAHAEGATVLFGRSDEAATVSHQPFVEALRHYAAACPLGQLGAQLGPSLAVLTRLVPELARRLPDLPATPSTDPEAEARGLHDAFAALLAAAGHGSPLVLFLDDLHLADKPTLRLLKDLVRSPAPSHLLALGTYRESDVKRKHPLSETLADLRRHQAFDRVPLRGLDEANVGALIHAWAGREAPPGFVRAIHEHTEGNPFFIEEVLRDLAETGADYERDGRLTTDQAIAGLGIPEGVKEVIGQRLARLSEECNSVLTIASVIGREFGIEALERASDLPVDRLMELLEEAVAARVIEEAPQVVGRYSFSHALTRETLYDDLTTTRRVRLHGQTLQYADNEGVKLAYEVMGSSGPSIIALGLSNCPAVRSRIRSIARHWERISRHYRVILYDRRGVGFSAAPDQGYDLAASVEDVRAILDAAEAERVVLWGATDGGPLAIAFAAQCGDRVAGLILAGTSPKLVSWGDFQWGISATVAESFLRLDAVDRGEAASRISSTRHYRLEDAEAIGEVMRRVPRRAWSQIVRAITVADARPFLTLVRTPTLIVHDPDNRYIPVEAAHYMHDQIPGSRLEITEEYGASLLGEALYRRIGAFIEEVTTDSPQHH